jgi:acyl carrier protein
MSDRLDDVLASLAQVAPEVDGRLLDRTAPLIEQLDIDSMDFLNFVAALCARCGIDIPEQDYRAVSTIDGAIAYLDRRCG